MGFLNRFYTREGAGVYRNHEQKKSAYRRFFEIFGRKWSALLRANLLYFLLSLPLVTGGLADVGLTYITRNAAREKFAYPCADFFGAVRRSWKQALPAGIIKLIVNLILGFNIYFYGVQIFFRIDGAKAGFVPWLMLFVNLFGMLFFDFLNYYVSVQIVTFSLKLKQIYKNAAIFAMANLYKNLLIAVCMLGVIAVLATPFLFLDYRVWMCMLLLIYALIYPAFRSLLIQFTIFPFIKKTMIDPYYAAHPEADRRAMRALNLEDDTEEDAVFTDEPTDGAQVQRRREGDDT